MRPTGSTDFTIAPAQLDALAAWLADQNFRIAAPLAADELARAIQGGEVVVLFVSGRVSCRGDERGRAARRLLAVCREG